MLIRLLTHLMIASALAHPSAGLAFGLQTSAASAAPAPAPMLHIPGRQNDARVARIAFRLGEAGRARCPVVEAGTGLVFQHLSQFHLVGRAEMIAAWALDRGAGVVAVVPGSPAALAGVRAGDVLLSIDGAPLPSEPGLADPFDSDRAHARADAVHALLASTTAPAIAVTLWRGGTMVAARIAPRPVCPSRVHLARSDQLNAYSDGRRVLLTTGLLARMSGDDELAFVIAHELAHNILGHARIMRGGQVARGIGRTLGRSGQIVRAVESDADSLATELMLDAGFDPVLGAQVLRRVGGSTIGLFADHAPTDARIAAIAALVQASKARAR
jgi:hypothetical protein